MTDSAAPPRAGSGIPRAAEGPLAILGLAAAAPVIALSALAVAATTREFPFFRQDRVGRGGRSFVLWKLRTMRAASRGAAVTAGGDPRVTRVGRLLRKTKLDELPELWNIAKGEMSFVGPRPEVPRYVDPADPLWARVLEARPGLTDPVTLSLRNEETLLAGIEGDREAFYREFLLPYKLRGYAEYLERRTGWTDLRVLRDTVWAVVRPSRAPVPAMREIVAKGLQSSQSAR